MSIFFTKCDILKINAQIVILQNNSSLSKSGNFAKSAELQIKLCGLIDALFCEPNPIPVKTALHEMGVCGNKLRLPLIDISDENKKVLLENMKKTGLV